MARDQRGSRGKPRRRIRNARAVLGVERLDARLALSANGGPFADAWLTLQPVGFAAPDDGAGPQVVSFVASTIAAARVSTTAAAPVVTSVKGPSGQAAGGVAGGYAITVSGSGFVDGSGTLLVQAVDFWTNPTTNVGGTGQITVAPGGTPTSATITVSMPALSLSQLPVATAVVVTVANAPISSQTITLSNTFTFVQQAQVTSLTYTDAQHKTRGPLQAQNGPLAGGGTLVINGTGFVTGSSVQFVDYGSPPKTFTVPASSVTVNAAGTQVSLPLPSVGQKWSTDTTVAVNVVPPQNGVPSFGPSNNAGGFTNQFTFFKAASTRIKIKLQPAVVNSGPIYFVAYSQQGDRIGKLQNYAPLIMQVTQPGTAGQNRGTWELGTSMITGKNVIDASKYQPLSFTKTKDANGYLTATVNYENLLYSQGYSNVSAGAVLSLGAFPSITAVGGLAGSPTVSDNPGLTYGLTELNVSGLATTNYSAPSTVVDLSFVDQFGMSLQATPFPAAPFPVTNLGVAGGTRQGAINQFANVLKQSTNPQANAFTPLISAAGTTQILAPKSYLNAVENQPGIKPTTSELAGGNLQPPVPPPDAAATGYFYWVTAVGDGGGETKFFGTGQTHTSPNTSPLYNTVFQTLDPGKNSILVTWGSFPRGVQSTAVSYNVYRQGGYTQASVAAQPIGITVQKLSVPVTSLSYLDDGNGNWDDVALPDVPSSNATYSLLSGFFDDALKQFFKYYETNDFVIHRDGITWKGTTVKTGAAGASLSYASTSGTSTLTWYGRGLVLHDEKDSHNQFVFLDPSSPKLTKNTWMQTTSNLGFSAGYQIFSACGAAGDGGPADAAAIRKAQPWKDLQNSIATAFDRGLATNFAVAPDAWANPPQFSAAAVVSQKSGTWSSGKLVPHSWTVTGVCNGVETVYETVYGVVTSLTPQSGKAVKLKWSTAPTGSQAYDSFNVYRAKGSPGQSLAWKRIATNVTFQPGAQTVVFLDTGLTGTPASPVTYFAPGTTSDLYAEFQHQIGSNGLAYGYGYDDQGAMSSTYTANGTPALNGYLNMLRITGFRWGNVGKVRFGTSTSKVVGLVPAPLPQQVVAGGVASLPVALQMMAQDSTTQAMFPAFGTDGWTARVLSQPAGTKALPGLVAGTAVPVSFMNGQAIVSLKNTLPVAGNTYTLAFGLYDRAGKRVKTAQGPVTATVTLTTC